MSSGKFLLLCLVLCGVVLTKVSGLGFSQPGQGQGQEQSFAQGRGQGGDNFAAGQQSGYGGAPYRNTGGRGAAPGGYAGSDEDARQYTFRIYMEPEYYGYESKIPGAKAMFKSYRSAPSGFGRQGQDGGYAGGYGSGGRGGKSSGGYGSDGNFGARGGQQSQY